MTQLQGDGGPHCWFFRFPGGEVRSDRPIGCSSHDDREDDQSGGLLLQAHPRLVAQSLSVASTPLPSPRRVAARWLLVAPFRPLSLSPVPAGTAAAWGVSDDASINGTVSDSCVLSLLRLIRLRWDYFFQMNGPHRGPRTPSCLLRSNSDTWTNYPRHTPPWPCGSEGDLF